MSEQDSSAEWLPVGWTTEVKVCRNGRKYKCYIDPSHLLKFHSKPEVIRYLNNIEIKHPISQEKNNDFMKPTLQEKNNLNVNRSGTNFVVEKTAAEGLPPGWFKEVKVSKRGSSIRRDAYYTDPVTGYIFRSLKDIERYLKTGELGKNAIKPKDKGHITMELGDDKSSSHAVAQGQKLPDSGTNALLIDSHCSKVEDEELLNFTSTEDQTHLTKHDSDQSIDSVAMSINPPETKSLDQRETKGESNSLMSVSTPVDGACTEKILDNGVENHERNESQRRTKNSNSKRAPDLPRRASKRLAGIELDPAPELKTNNRTRRVAAAQPGEAETSSSKNFCDLATPEEHPGKPILAPLANEKSEISIVLPVASLPISEVEAGEEKPKTISEEQAGEEEPLPISEKQAGEEEPLKISEKQAGEDPSLISAEQTREVEPLPADVNPGSPLNLSLEDLWTDPCIEFAIKTLTGAIPVGDENKADENPGSSLDLPFGELWTDPCIEFAVKTLTGAIPVGEDLGIQNFFQHQVSSSDSQGVSGRMLPNVDNFSQTDYISQHFDAVEKLPNRHQATVASQLLHTGNRSFQNSGGTALHQHVDKRNSGECP